MGHWIAGLFLLLVGGFGAWRAQTLEIGNLRQPGPGLFPLAVALVLCALAVAMLLSLTRAPAAPIQWPSRPALLRLVVCLAMFVGYALVVDELGYLASTLLLTGFLASVVFRKAWGPSLAMAALSVGLSWALFAWILGVQLPRASWW